MWGPVQLLVPAAVLTADSQCADINQLSPNRQTYSVRCRYNTVNFLQNPHERRPVDREDEIWGAFCDFNIFVIYVPPLHLRCCMWYHFILSNSIITAPEYTSNLSIYETIFLLCKTPMIGLNTILIYHCLPMCAILLNHQQNLGMVK